MTGIVFFSRGIKQDVETAVKFLETRMLPLKYKVKQKDGTFKEETNYIQSALRPIQLYELVVPNPTVPSVLKAIFPANNEKQYSKIKTMLRKVMGLKKVDIPKNDKIPKLAIPSQLFRNINMQFVGIKRDKYGALDNDVGNVIGERL